MTQTKSNKLERTSCRSSTKKNFVRPVLNKLLDWLAGCLRSTPSELVLAKRLLNKILDVLDTRGKPECIKYTKNLRLNFMKFFMKSSSDENMILPSSLKFIKNINRAEGLPFIRLIFSVLYVTRFIELKPVPSFSSIESAPRFVGTPFNYFKDMTQFLKELGVNPQKFGSVPFKLKFKEFHMSSKSGPNGHALWSSYVDSMILPPDLENSLHVVGGPKLGELLSRMKTLVSKIPTFFLSRGSPKGQPQIRKLACISDKEGKTREVAILDYYSQCALKPLHEYIFK